MPEEESVPEGTELAIIELTFPIGTLVSTPGALELVERLGASPFDLLARHCRRDWGDLDDEDKRSNDHDLKHGGRLLSAYKMADGSKVWIITEWDRSVTTILLPEEY